MLGCALQVATRGVFGGLRWLFARLLHGVIYATYDAMYPYAFRILKDEILSKTVDGTLLLSANENFLFRKSEFKDMNFTSYVKYKANSTSMNYDLLCETFIKQSFTASDNTTLPYRLYLPSNYDGKKDYPVIVFLHGAGERGDNNSSQLINMMPALFNHEDKELIENAIIIAPQCPGWPNQWVDTPWSDGNYNLNSVPESNELKAVVELLEYIKSRFSTDEDRYYAMGISMGGFGTWDLLPRFGE